MARIVSLIASSTEIVYALGLGDQMVGRSHECDYPAGVKDLPVCTGPKFSPDGTSYEIDQRVKAILQESLSVYRVDADLLDRLRPTHIITQAQCEVCAVSLKDVEAAACQLINSKPAIVSLEPNSLADIWIDIDRIGNALGVAERARHLACSLIERIDLIARRAVRQPVHPRIACIEWIEPLMVAGNWVPELVGAAGGENLIGEAGKHSPKISWQELIAHDPEVIVVTPCGFDIDRTLREMPLLSHKAGYGELTAVKNERVFVADGNQYFNRPGPRVVESLEILAELIHPSEFLFGHEGAGWVRYLPVNAKTL